MSKSSGYTNMPLSPKMIVFLAMICFYNCLTQISAPDVVQQLLDCDQAAVSLRDVKGCTWMVAYNAKTLALFNTTKRRLIQKHPTVKSEVDSLNKDWRALDNIYTEIQNNVDLLSQLLAAGSATLDRRVRPSVTIRFHDLEGLGHPSQLQCTVAGFYPKALQILWLRNGRRIQSQVLQTLILPNSDGTFQTAAYVGFDPETTAVYACQVEHASFAEGYRAGWESQGTNSLTPGAIVGILFGIAGIAAAVAVGVVRWKRQVHQTQIITLTVTFNKDHRRSDRSQASTRSKLSASSANSGDGLTQHAV